HHRSRAARAWRKRAVRGGDSFTERRGQQPSGPFRRGELTCMAPAQDGAVKELFSAAEIAERVEHLAREIASAKLDDLLIVAILKGSFIFAADLVRALHAQGLKPEIDFIFLASYDGEAKSSGAVKLL